MNEDYISDLTKWHTGKWYEVCILSTNDPNEKEEVIAKFKSLNDAKRFASLYVSYSVGFHSVIGR